MCCSSVKRCILFRNNLDTCGYVHCRSDIKMQTTRFRAPASHATPSHLALPSAVSHVAPRCLVVQRAQKTQDPPARTFTEKVNDLTGLGDALGPIGLTISESVTLESKPRGTKAQNKASAQANSTGVDLGPIGMTFGGTPQTSEDYDLEAEAQTAKSIHSMTTAEWRALYEKDGTVDLWVEEEFNAGSRLVGGRAVHKGGVYGFMTGEGPTAGEVATHKVKIFDHYANQVVDVEVPEDRYILWEAEDKGLQLPYACRMGCCTACAVRIKEGDMYQPEALGISEELKRQGYGLMCVGFPNTDLVLETVSEDEVYELQFGKSFATGALDVNSPNVERDDFALEIANMDE